MFLYMSHVTRKQDFRLGENKGAVTAKLISAFVFATWIVQFLFFLNPKIQASSHLLKLHRLVCVRPGWKPRRPVFLRFGSYHNDKESILQNFFLTLDRRQYYELVICNHGPQPRGIAGTLTFGPANTRAKSPTLRELLIDKTTAVFPRSLLLFHFTALFASIKQTKGFPPHCRGKTLVKALLISMAIPAPPPWVGGGGAWLQMTSALK